jgi:hypothetical protein
MRFGALSTTTACNAGREQNKCTHSMCSRRRGGPTVECAAGGEEVPRWSMQQVARRSHGGVCSRWRGGLIVCARGGHVGVCDMGCRVGVVFGGGVVVVTSCMRGWGSGRGGGHTEQQYKIPTFLLYTTPQTGLCGCGLLAPRWVHAHQPLIERTHTIHTYIHTYYSALQCTTVHYRRRRAPGNVSTTPTAAPTATRPVIV